MKAALGLFKWMFLVIVALGLLVIVTAVAFPIGLFRSVYKRKVGSAVVDLTNYFKRIAISLDQLGNVSGFTKLSFLFIYSNGYPFGNEDETISYVLKMNEESGTLRTAGKWLFYVIDKIDPGHFVHLTD